jgi:hypothetical protein
MKKSKKIQKKLEARKAGFVTGGKHQRHMPGSQNLRNQ